MRKFTLFVLGCCLVVVLVVMAQSVSRVEARSDIQHCVGFLSPVEKGSEIASDVSTVECYDTFEEASSSVTEDDGDVQVEPSDNGEHCVGFLSPVKPGTDEGSEITSRGC